MRTRSLALLLLACRSAPPAPAPAPSAPASSPAASPSPSPAPSAAAPGPPSPMTITGRALALPGVTGPASLDYMLYEADASRLWVPIGASGSVALLDTKTGAFKSVSGFATRVSETPRGKRALGPNAAALGDGFVYVGVRATGEVCPIETKTLAVKPCVKLPSPSDGVDYVAASKEIWVTMPSASSLAVLDASKPDAPKLSATIKLAGEPEGYAHDDARGVFFTNLEDRGGTVVLDVAKHAAVATWSTGCGADGPRGLAYDRANKILFVACTDHVETRDAAGALVSKLETGAGVDNIDFHARRRLLYAAAGKAMRLTIAKVSERGEMATIATGATSEGARNPIAGADGDAYVGDSLGARLWVFPPP